MVNPAILADLRRTERDWLDEIAASVLEHGVRQPLQIVVDATGKVCLRDGHHRVCIALEQGITELPVEVLQAERVGNAFRRPLTEMLAPLLQTVDGSDHRLRRAATFALEALEDGGTRGWGTGDAICALRVGLGLPIGELERARMTAIDAALENLPPGRRVEYAPGA